MAGWMGEKKQERKGLHTVEVLGEHSSLCDATPRSEPCGYSPAAVGPFPGEVE